MVVIDHRQDVLRTEEDALHGVRGIGKGSRERLTAEATEVRLGERGRLALERAGRTVEPRYEVRTVPAEQLAQRGEIGRAEQRCNDRQWPEFEQTQARLHSEDQLAGRRRFGKDEPGERAAQLRLDGVRVTTCTDRAFADQEYPVALDLAPARVGIDALARTAALAALRQHKAQQAEDRLRSGSAWLDSEAVFTDETGALIEATKFLRNSFGPLLKAAGLPPMRFHDLRHTAATLLLGRGVHPKIVSEMLGHSQIAITLDLYSHVTPTMQREATAAMDAIVSG